jgi:hypothetical protein
VGAHIFSKFILKFNGVIFYYDYIGEKLEHAEMKTKFGVRKSLTYIYSFLPKCDNVF